MFNHVRLGPIADIGGATGNARQGSMTDVKKARNAAGRYGPLLFCLSVIAPRGANASCPTNTPAGLALGGPGHADTGNPCHTRSASVSGLRDDVRRVNRRNWHCLCWHRDA